MSLKQKLLDPDEKVRAAVCKLYAALDYETSLHYVSEEQLHALGERSMDKKVCNTIIRSHFYAHPLTPNKQQSVRQEAITSIAKLYSVAYPQM